MHSTSSVRYPGPHLVEHSLLPATCHLSINVSCFSQRNGAGGSPFVCFIMLVTIQTASTASIYSICTATDLPAQRIKCKTCLCNYYAKYTLVQIDLQIKLWIDQICHFRGGSSICRYKTQGKDKQRKSHIHSYTRIVRSSYQNYAHGYSDLRCHDRLKGYLDSCKGLMCTECSGQDSEQPELKENLPTLEAWTIYG